MFIEIFPDKFSFSTRTTLLGKKKILRDFTEMEKYIFYSLFIKQLMIQDLKKKKNVWKDIGSNL